MCEKKEKVLIVEDTKAVAEVHSAALKTSFDVEIVGRCDRTLERLRRRQQNPIDLILLDMMLPNGEGWDVVRPVYLEAPEVPIVVVTGFDIDIDVRVAACVVAYLRKPVSIAGLKDAIVHAMIKKRICNRTMPIEQQLARVRQLIGAT